MKYVKLVAHPDTWFREGTEVYDYDSTLEYKKRITLEEWNRWRGSPIILVRGFRICESPTSENVPLGEEYFDGESCGKDEFDVTEIEE